MALAYINGAVAAGSQQQLDTEIELIQSQLLSDFGDKGVLEELHQAYLLSERTYKADLLQRGASDRAAGSRRSRYKVQMPSQSLDV